jgi:hypothetical protein
MERLNELLQTINNQGHDQFVAGSLISVVLGFVAVFGYYGAYRLVAYARRKRRESWARYLDPSTTSDICQMVVKLLDPAQISEWVPTGNSRGMGYKRYNHHGSNCEFNCLGNFFVGNELVKFDRRETRIVRNAIMATREAILKKAAENDLVDIRRALAQVAGEYEKRQKG